MGNQVVLGARESGLVGYASRRGDMSSLNGFDSVPAKEPNLGLAADFCKACLRLCIIPAVCVYITIPFRQNHISLNLKVTGGEN